MSGRLHIVGVGPGDPELMTVKAARILATAPLVAFFAKAGRRGHARTIADAHLSPGAEELRFDYPFTTEVSLSDPRYLLDMGDFYRACAAELSARLDQGRDIALLCEGDPFFYGSAMYLYDRLAGRHPIDVIPGVTGMSGCWARAGAPMTHGDDVLSIVPGTLEEDVLSDRLRGCDAAVIMKLGRNFPKVRAVLEELGLAERALYVERATMANQKIVPLDQVEPMSSPYFSLIIVPGERWQG